MYTVLYKFGGLSAEEIRSFCELHKGLITSKSLVLLMTVLMSLRTSVRQTYLICHLNQALSVNHQESATDKFHFVKYLYWKQMVPRESSAEEVSFE